MSGNGRKMNVLQNVSISLSGEGAVGVQVFEIIYIEDTIATSAFSQLSLATRVRFPGKDLKILFLICKGKSVKKKIAAPALTVIVIFKINCPLKIHSTRGTKFRGPSPESALGLQVTIVKKLTLRSYL